MMQSHKTKTVLIIAGSLLVSAGIGLAMYFFTRLLLLGIAPELLLADGMNAEIDTVAAKSALAFSVLLVPFFLVIAYAMRIYVRRVMARQSVAIEKAKAAMVISLKDVENEKREVESLARDLEKFKLAVENASDLIIITDQDGIVLYANRATEAVTGFSREEMRGKTPALWGKQMERAFYEDFWTTVKKYKEPFNGEITNRRKNQVQYIAEIHVSPVLDWDGRVRFFVGIERDITKAKEVDQAKTEFVSMASHQLRTPLTSIKWYIEMLENGDAGALTEEQLQYLKEVHESNERMIGLVNDLLHVSRIDMDTIKITPKPANAIAIVKSVISELRPLVEKKQVTIEEFYRGDLSEINADPELLRIIFQNLLSNAVKYNVEKGKVAATVANENNNLTVTVSDTGYGIPENAKDRIFTKLFRAENAKERESEGSGLGMYIVKSVVERSRGRVWFESEENNGTTFHVEIPLVGK